MDSRHSIKRIVAVVILALWLSNPVSAVIHTFGGQFNLPIPEDSGQSRGWMGDAVINVTEHIIISDIDIEINITHTSAFDLQLFLQNPAGTSVLLNIYTSNEFFEGADYIGTIFDDEADLSIEEAHSPFTGRFRPKSPGLLSIFDGQDPYGIWRLSIYDAYYANIGTLDNAQLLISTPEPGTSLLLCFGIGILLKNRRRVRLYGLDS
jgi:subtilisin-like proprotein convertase family protein